MAHNEEIQSESGFLQVKLDPTTTLYAVRRPLAFSGHYKLAVLRGTVVLSGTQLSASETEHTIANPAAPYHCISPAFSLTDLNLVPELAVSALGSEPTVVRITAVSDPLKPWLDLVPPFRSLESTNVDRLAEHRVAADGIRILPSWRNLASQIHTGDTLVSFGPKSAGKSTLARLVTNCKLMENQRVYYLDLDPGQPEFAPPGTMSLHLLGPSLNFSPPWLHARMDNAVAAASLGFVSPMDTPGRYLDIVQTLYQRWLECAREDGPCILVVNTPGWTKGLGLDLNAAVANTVRPTHAVHLGIGESFDDLRNQIAQLSQDEIELVAIDAFAEESTNSSPMFSAAELRMLQTMAYFYQHSSLHLTEWCPYELAIDATCATGKKIAGMGVIDGDGLDPEDIDICVEGTFVALVAVRAAQGVELISNQSIPVMHPEAVMDIHQVGNCIGYGIVQSINRATKTCRLLTPVDPSIAANHYLYIIRGRQTLPTWAYVNTRDLPKNGHVPWVSVQLQGPGSVYTRFRRNLGRK